MSGVPDVQRIRHVLIVEDNALVAMDIEATLNDAGFTALIATQGKKALRAIETEVFDCAVLDVSIVVQQAQELADVLQARKIPCLFSTARSEDSVPMRYRHHPILYKPFSGEKLMEFVHLAMGQNRERENMYQNANLR